VACHSIYLWSTTKPMVKATFNRMWAWPVQLRTMVALDKISCPLKSTYTYCSTTKLRAGGTRPTIPIGSRLLHATAPRLSCRFRLTGLTNKDAATHARQVSFWIRRLAESIQFDVHPSCKPQGGERPGHERCPTLSGMVAHTRSSTNRIRPASHRHCISRHQSRL
jgi:hypothetical protein